MIHSCLKMMHRCLKIDAQMLENDVLKVDLVVAQDDGLDDGH